MVGMVRNTLIVAPGVPIDALGGVLAVIAVSFRRPVRRRLFPISFWLNSRLIRGDPDRRYSRPRSATPCWTRLLACSLGGGQPGRFAADYPQLHGWRRCPMRDAAGARDSRVSPNTSAWYPIPPPRPLRSRLTLCQVLAAPRLATPSVRAALYSLPSQAATSRPPIPHRRGHAQFCAPLPRPISPVHLDSRLIHGSPGAIPLRSAWRTRGGSLCACPPCSRNFVTFSGSKKERPQRRLLPIDGVAGISWRLS